MCLSATFFTRRRVAGTAVPGEQIGIKLTKINMAASRLALPAVAPPRCRLLSAKPPSWTSRKLFFFLTCLPKSVYFLGGGVLRGG